MKILLMLSFAMLIFFGILFLFLFISTGPVDIEDPALRVALQNQLELEIADFGRKDLERVSILDLRPYKINSLEELKYLPNLRVVYLGCVDNLSLRPLNQHHNLEKLFINETAIESLHELDFFELAGLRGLRFLSLSNNYTLSDISALRGFSRLEVLELRYTAVSDLTVLQYLGSLQTLDLRGTDLSRTDLTVLKERKTLEHLNLRETSINELSFLAELAGLRYLNLHSNIEIESFEALAELSELRELILRNTSLGDNLVFLRQMPRLQRLNIRNTGIESLEVLQHLMRTGTLQDHPEKGITAHVDIRDNPITPGQTGYELLLPYWSNVSTRFPSILPGKARHGILINEVMTSNRSSLQDSDGDFPNWIELYNPGTEPFNLSRSFLQADLDSEQTWIFPEDTVIEGESFLLVFASGKDMVDADGALHSCFTLPYTGALLMLGDKDQETVYDIVRIPELDRDMSYGREQEASTSPWRKFFQSSPGLMNRQSVKHVPLQFSHNAGFFSNEFFLELSIDAADQDKPLNFQIYYTLDGSEPHPDTAAEAMTYTVKNSQTGEVAELEKRSFLYKAPILIQDMRQPHSRTTNENAVFAKLSHIPTTVPEAHMWYWQRPELTYFDGTVVRAAVFSDVQHSPVFTKSFFVNENDKDFPLPLISIVMDPEYLFSYEKGVYVPGKIYDQYQDLDQYWMRRPANYRERWEWPASFEFFDETLQPSFSVDGGLRVHGDWSRSQPLKSLRFYSRKEYSTQNYFQYPLFPENYDTVSSSLITDYRRLLLRSGQGFARNFIQDALSHTHVRDYVHVDLLAAVPYVHFINGEYWGIKNLRERFDKHYIASHYGVDSADILLVDDLHHLSPSADAAEQEAFYAYRNLHDYVVNNNMAEREHYAYVCEKMDVLSFIDYNIIRIFSGDADGVSKHVRIWKLKNNLYANAGSGVDGRWRWHTWDMDNALMFVEHDILSRQLNDLDHKEFRDLYNQRNTEAIQRGERSEAEPFVSVADKKYTEFIVNLLANKDFVHLFINRFADLLNTVYRPEIYTKAVQAAVARIEPEIRRHIDRWQYPESYEQFQYWVERSLDFAERRADIQRQHILRFFRERGHGLSSLVQLTVEASASGGTIRVNSLYVDDEKPEVLEGRFWHGLYFKTIPVEIEAIPARGYQFSHWEGSLPEDLLYSQKILVDLAEDLQIAAVFIQQ